MPPRDLRALFEECADAIGAAVETEMTQWSAVEYFVSKERQAFSDWQILGVEVPMEAALRARSGREVLLTAKPDLLVRDRRTKQAFSVDWKTAASERGSIEVSYGLSPVPATTMLCSAAFGGQVVAGWDDSGEPLTTRSAKTHPWALSPDGSDGVAPGESVNISYVWITEILTRKKNPDFRGCSVSRSTESLLDFVDAVASCYEIIDRGDSSIEDSWPRLGALNGRCGGGLIQAPCRYFDLCRHGRKATVLYRSEPDLELVED